ncbi:hypothetical protein QR680_000586 [Steinernema hermaphroditum]|uniref:Aquaporin n=1 Tax=Steinernema hermaphroditum TaxID=289476 RepID=A0AA39GV51_9BILA|nr:hypothetical protein QR680_000586 [Steinernema hermaphroditum]
MTRAAPSVREVLAEFLGTFLLQGIGGLCIANAVLSNKPANDLGMCIGFSLAISFSVALTYDISGGFINPAVSLVFFSFGDLSLLKLISYVVAQCLAAVCASLLVLVVYYDAIMAVDGSSHHFTFGNASTAHLFASFPADYLTLTGGLVDQTIGCALFIFLIVFIGDTRHGIPRLVRPLLFGLAFAAVTAGIGINAGYPLNPADLCSRLFIYTFVGYGPHVFEPLNGAWIWVPVVAPLIGALLGGWLYKFTIGCLLNDADRQL